MKRPLILSCIALLLIASAIYYRHSVFTPSPPAGLPADAFPCRFGWALHWVSIGVPGSRQLADGAKLELFDCAGNLLEREFVALATPPRFMDMTGSRGCKMLPNEKLREFDFPHDKIAKGSGSDNNIVIKLDSERALVPYWWFK